MAIHKGRASISKTRHKPKLPLDGSKSGKPRKRNGLKSAGQPELKSWPKRARPKQGAYDVANAFPNLDDLEEPGEPEGAGAPQGPRSTSIVSLSPEASDSDDAPLLARVNPEKYRKNKQTEKSVRQIIQEARKLAFKHPKTNYQAPSVSDADDSDQGRVATGAQRKAPEQAAKFTQREKVTATAKSASEFKSNVAREDKERLLELLEYDSDVPPETPPPAFKKTKSTQGKGNDGAKKGGTSADKPTPSKQRANKPISKSKYAHISKVPDIRGFVTVPSDEEDFDSEATYNDDSDSSSDGSWSDTEMALDPDVDDLGGFSPNYRRHEDDEIMEDV